VVLHCGIAAVVTGSLAKSGYVPNAALALGVGAAAPVAIKHMSAYTLSILPRPDHAKGEHELDEP
jgi:hypothetical protein